jgi:DNA-directed RNA polymerase specialized sigma24 family protein
MSIAAPLSHRAVTAGPSVTRPAAASSRKARLAEPALTASLSHFVGGSRVPAADVDDIVQAALTEALAAETAPEDAEEIRRWVFGIARHKVADWYRARRREVPLELESLGEPPVRPPLPADAGADAAADVAADANDLLRWAERELPDGPENARTLQWLLREGQGESLEAIAAEESLEPPRVRQRVSRLRRHFRARWALQAAALAALVAVAIVLAMALRKKSEPIAPRTDPTIEPTPLAPLPVPLPALPESRPAASSAAPISTGSRSFASDPAPSAFTSEPAPMPSAIPTMAPSKPEAAPAGKARGSSPHSKVPGSRAPSSGP